MNKTGYSEKAITARFESMLKAYAEGRTHLGYPPQPLFDKNGRFNDENWNSDQDIRALLESDELFDERMDNPFEAWINASEDEPGFDYIEYGVFWSGKKRRDDQAYIMINIVRDDSIALACDSYMISWYKSRGKTDAILKNGSPITLREYCVLLGLLDRAGFFKLGHGA